MLPFVTAFSNMASINIADAAPQVVAALPGSATTWSPHGDCAHPPGDSVGGQYLARRAARVAGQHAVELVARAGVELDEDLAQVVA